MKNIRGEDLADIQNTRPDLAIPIDRVGIRGARIPLKLRDRTNGQQICVASADLGVDLPPSRKGTHMSRLIEILDGWDEELDPRSLRGLLQTAREKLSASRAWAGFNFPYLIRKASPAAALRAYMAYDCSISGELDERGLTFLVGAQAPVMTVCPCSKAISEEGAHSQRAIIRMKILMAKFVWLEELIELAESCASSSVYPLLKRSDEKFVTERAFAHPAFVEDVARQVADKLSALPGALRYEVEVESMESIHNHNAFAFIRGGSEAAPGLWH
ncbi:MAG: GTP cyclohydrolase FolE2 [Desulfovibrio sp.]|nr:GTP cyclohydrolase FolE2 [Desulfovibrio sp.]